MSHRWDQNNALHLSCLIEAMSITSNSLSPSPPLPYIIGDRCESPTPTPNSHSFEYECEFSLPLQFACLIHFSSTARLFLQLALVCFRPGGDDKAKQRQLCQWRRFQYVCTSHLSVNININMNIKINTNSERCTSSFWHNFFFFFFTLQREMIGTIAHVAPEV